MIKLNDKKIIKKNGTTEDFKLSKVISAINKSAYRAISPFTPEEIDKVCNLVTDLALKTEGNISVPQMHNIVEKALDDIKPVVAKSYRDYRNYKQDFVDIIDKIYKKAQSIKYVGDKSNANTDSTLVSTKRSLIYNELNKELYQKFFMTVDELQACEDGYIYVHDMVSRRDSINCCLFDIETVLTGGFEMGNQWYTEPKSLDVAFDLISDVVFCAASQQYGGFTLPNIEKVLKPYAEKSYKIHYDKYKERFGKYNVSHEELDRYALQDVDEEFRQGFQGWECKFNTVSSSRGDYPFITVTAGNGTSHFEKMAIFNILKVRKEGQGKEGFKKPVLFPKLVFLYDSKIHGEGCISEDTFLAAVDCTMSCMYPDYLSLDGDDTLVSRMYKEYGKVISPMGCRAFLAPWYKEGGLTPANEKDEPIFVGRFNGGAISLNLVMILAKAREENKDFYEVLDKYLETIRNLHRRTYDFIGEFRASTNPMAFCQGGFYGGNLHPDDKIKSIIKPMTLSFGITSLNELQQLYNGTSLVEDGSFAIEVLEYINKQVAKFKEEDGLLYAIYGTPAESLAGTQLEQFRKKYGIIENVSDKEYFTNSFHCVVSEDITPIEKQDYEKRFWNLSAGGRIQYVRYPNNYNTQAFITIIRRAMKMGFYEGANMNMTYCEDCGLESLDTDVCPYCSSVNITTLDRVCGYLGYSRIKGDTRFNKAKLAEVRDRVSM